MCHAEVESSRLERTYTLFDLLCVGIGNIIFRVIAYVGKVELLFHCDIQEIKVPVAYPVLTSPIALQVARSEVASSY